MDEGSFSWISVIIFLNTALFYTGRMAKGKKLHKER